MSIKYRYREFKDDVKYFGSLQALGYLMHDFYYNVLGRFIFLFEKTLFYFKHAIVKDFDFDSHGMFYLLLVKLQRLDFALKNGCSVIDPKALKALRVAIKLAKRLSEDLYEIKVYTRHNKKWGDLVWKFEAADSNKYSEIIFSRPNARSKEDKDQELKESIDAYSLAIKTQERDSRIFFAIIEKYYRYWWD